MKDEYIYARVKCVCNAVRLVPVDGSPVTCKCGAVIWMKPRPSEKYQPMVKLNDNRPVEGLPNKRPLIVGWE